MTARLVVSLSGVNDRTLDVAAVFADELAGRRVPLSLLVAPRRRAWHGLTDTAAWIGGLTDAAVLLHGYDHVAPAGTARIGRRAEFAALPAHEAGLRLVAATAALERLGLSTDLFAPPGWHASPGTMNALRRRGFALCADATGVHDLRGGKLHRGRVFGFGRGELAEPLWCRAVLLAAASVARRGGLLRLTADADDLRRDGPRRTLLDAVDNALRHGAAPCTYRSLCQPAPIRRAAAVPQPAAVRRAA